MVYARGYRLEGVGEIFISSACVRLAAPTQKTSHISTILVRVDQNEHK